MTRIPEMSLHIIDKGENSIIVKENLSGVLRVYFEENESVSIVSSPDGSIVYFNTDVSKMESGFYKITYKILFEEYLEDMWDNFDYNIK